MPWNGEVKFAIRNKQKKIIFEFNEWNLQQDEYKKLQEEFENECWITIEKVYETRWDC